MTTTRPWTQSDSHLDSPTSQLLWLRKLSRGDEIRCSFSGNGIKDLHLHTRVGLPSLLSP